MTPSTASRESAGAGAYFYRSPMAHTLESLQPGTPVYVGELNVGAVRGVYSEGNSRQAELLVVHWSDRGEDVAISTNEVSSVDDSGVMLLALDPSSYASLPTFDRARFPTVRPLL